MWPGKIIYAKLSKGIFLYFLYFFTRKKSTENPENIFYVNIVFRMATKCVCIMCWHYAAYQNDSNLGEGIKPPQCTVETSFTTPVSQFPSKPHASFLTS